MNTGSDLLPMHLVAGNKVNVVYDTQSMNLLKVSNDVYEILTALKKGTSLADVLATYQCSEQQIANLVTFLKEGKKSVHKVCKPTSEKVVERITLHVSNDCNLRCKYCYANGGSYNQNRALMPLDIAEKFVDFCVGNFDKVKYIVFFGGEPLLNVPVMEYICAEFGRRYANGLAKSMPAFGMITNGTILDDGIVHFIRDNLSFVTVSIDGIGEYNDANRVFANGKGSYHKIHSFIHTLKRETSVKVRYEATYTNYHIEKGLSIGDISKAIESEFGISGEVIEELNVQERANADFWHGFEFEKWKQEGCHTFPEGFWSILEALHDKRPKLMCGIARTIFSVAVNGDIYPCHINTGEASTCLGNIAGIHVFNSHLFKQEHFPVDVEYNKACESCWACSICGGCSRTWFYDKERKTYLPHPKSELCEKNKRHLENILLLIAMVRSDAGLWRKLIDREKLKIRV